MMRSVWSFLRKESWLASLRVDNFRTDKDAELNRLRAALSAPSMIGIKLAHAHQHFRMDDSTFLGFIRSHRI